MSKTLTVSAAATVLARNHIKPLAAALALFLVVVLVLGLHRDVKAPDGGVKISVLTLKGQNFDAQIADTPELLTRGLSNRDALRQDEAMLFVFPAPNDACFWMKDMRFNLDMLWFDAQNKLIHEQQNLAPSTYPQTFCAPNPAAYVVEVNAGTAARLGLTIGDTLTLQKQ